jgi:hypothetical protein
VPGRQREREQRQQQRAPDHDGPEQVAGGGRCAMAERDTLDDGAEARQQRRLDRERQQQRGEGGGAHGASPGSRA